MKLTAPYRCDYCLNTKGEANHWWLRWKGINGASRGPQFWLIAWDEAKADTDDHEHICSEQCASKALSKWMGEQKPIALREPITVRQGGQPKVWDTEPLDEDWTKTEGR